MSEPTLVFPPDSPDPTASDSALASAPEFIADTERLRRLLSSPRAREESPGPSGAPEDDTAADPNDFSFSFNEENLIPKKTTWANNTRNDFYEPVVDPRDLSDSSSTFYSRAPDFQPDSKITVQRTLLVSEPHASASHSSAQAQRPATSGSSSTTAHDADPYHKARPEKKTITNFARKQRPVRPPSRSPERDGLHNEQATGSPDRGKTAPKSKDGSRRGAPGKDERPDSKDSKPERTSFRRTRSLLGRRKLASPEPKSKPPQPQPSSTPPRTASPSKRPMTPILKSLSNTSLTSLAFSGRKSAEVPPMPGPVDTDKYKSSVATVQKKRDELWPVFRSLEHDASKFLSKSISQKTHMVRMNLIPFLRSYASHPSNKTLRPEDLDRRTMILNKWWTGLLDMLSLKNYQHVSGGDRPTVFEAITGLMERPEWRAYPSAFCPVADRIATLAAQSDESKPLHPPDSSDFMLESVHHNVRNVFTQNILTQVSFVVDKMSLRSTPVSLVAFCGKTCAYAFFFCPGVAEILVKLWDVRPQNVQRILRAHGMRRGFRLPDFSETIAANFPQSVRPLAFSSLRSLSEMLKQNPVFPVGLNAVQWHAHWANRWSGGDSDLFYVFVKNFHLLTSDFLPPDASKEEKLSAPGMLLVHAQILSNLDTTIHRSSLQSAAEGTNDSPVTFDSLLAADDAAATAVQNPPANAGRAMAENRLVLLLKDMLSDRMPRPPSLLFAESFCSTFRAAAESTSLYNHDSCFTLCDFFQEAFTIIARFQSGLAPLQKPFRWPFWLTVFKQMVKSQSTTTEIRLYSLLFTIWNEISSDESWKVQLCMDFLLEVSHFHSTFNHWCPMVRAYFMRLLCWRLARCDSEPSENDAVILQTLMKRLMAVWSHHKYLIEQADKNNLLLPSTAPCNPAPGRKLLIIRTDTPASNSFMMIDSMTLGGSSNDANRPDSPPVDSGPDPSSSSSFFERLASGLESIDTPKKRSGLLRSLLGYRSTDSPTRSESPKPPSDDASSPPESSSSSREPSPERNNGTSRSSMYEQRPSIANARPTNNSSKAATPAAKPFTQAFFRFSLEAVDRRPHNLPRDIPLQPPRVPLAAQLHLESLDDFAEDSAPSKPKGSAALESRYAGRALAEWTWVVNECQNFFERRRNEGVPSKRLVETPVLGVESFRKLG